MKNVIRTKISFMFACESFCLLLWCILVYLPGFYYLEASPYNVTAIACKRSVQFNLLPRTELRTARGCDLRPQLIMLLIFLRDKCWLVPTVSSLLVASKVIDVRN